MMLQSRERTPAWKAALRHLDYPRCARELRERTELPRKTVESALGRMSRDRVVRCATPTVKQARLYTPTVFGHMIRLEMGARPIPRRLASRVSLEDYSWVQAGLYRRLICSKLIEPIAPRELRRHVIEAHERIGMSHVHQVLRSLESRGLAEVDERLWAPTLCGHAVRAIMLWGLQPKARVDPSPRSSIRRF